MKSHELARELLDMPDKYIEASVDISTGDDDIGRRAFGSLIGINNKESPRVMLLFEGLLNDT